jgi:hypothetical protein
MGVILQVRTRIRQKTEETCPIDKKVERLVDKRSRSRLIELLDFFFVGVALLWESHYKNSLIHL